MNSLISHQPLQLHTGKSRIKAKCCILKSKVLQHHGYVDSLSTGENNLFRGAVNHPTGKLRNGHNVI